MRIRGAAEEAAAEVKEEEEEEDHGENVKCERTYLAKEREREIRGRE